MTFQQFLVKWTNPSGQRIDYDHQYAFQCVDLIRQYCYECFSLGNSAGGVPYAISYFTSPPSGIRQNFTVLPITDVQAGDIAVIKDATPGNDATSHIGIGTGNQNATQFEMLEQNGGTGNGSGTGTDAIRTRWVYKTRLAGILRPNNQAVAAPTPPAVGHVAANVGQLLNLPAAAVSWHVYNAGGPYTLPHAVAVLAPAKYGGLQYTIQGNPATDVYLITTRDYGQVAIYAGPGTGATISDPTPTPPPAPATPSAPAPPVVIPTNTTPYFLVKSLLSYPSTVNAVNRTNTNGRLAPGNYFIFNDNKQLNNTYSLTKVPGQSQSTWINIADNVADPEPVVVSVAAPEAVQASAEVSPASASPIENEASIRASYRPIMPDSSPIECQLLTSVLVTDILHDSRTITLKKGGMIHIYGTFEARGQWYARPKTNGRDPDYYFYGIPINSPTDLKPYLDDIYSVGDRLKYGWELVYDKAYKTIDGIYRAIIKKK